VTKTIIPLGETAVEGSINITMDVYMNFTNERGRKTQSVNFYLYKGEGEDKKFVGNVSVADRGEEGMEIIDRLVSPSFREQGFGKTLMACAEAFIKKDATERQRPIKAFAIMSQLDVIYLFWENGYRPETDEDMNNLEMILTGHEDLALAERFFVFKKGTPDTSKYFVKPNGEFALDDNRNRVINYNNALRIKMAKPIEAGKDEEVAEIVQRIKDAAR
jgi:predicted GNAT family acetyltransferase